MHQNAPVQFIYTPYLSVSHITVVRKEPEIIMFGLYGNLIHNQMQEIIIQCDFTQINDLLHLADFVADETIEHLSGIVSAGVTEPKTIDITDTGGINFNDLLFCLEPLLEEGEEGDAILQEEPEYHLHAFIKKDKSFPDFETSLLPAETQLQADYYLRILSVRYDFYLHFTRQKMKTEQALHYAGLQDDLVLRLAKIGYDLRLKMHV